MFLDELDQIERKEKQDPREERRLIPIDSFSQLDTGYTGRPDGDVIEDQKHDRRLQQRYIRAMKHIGDREYFR